MWPQLASVPCPSVVERVDEEERHSASRPAARNVGSELDRLGGVLRGLECRLDRILESEVESLGWEIPEHVRQVSCESISEANYFEHVSPVIYRV